MTLTQPSLFGPRARTVDPWTSHAAALTVGQGATAAVLNVYRATFEEIGRGLTDDEMCARVTDDPRRWPTLKSARSRLTNSGWLYDTGLTRLSERGRAQIVWCYRERPTELVRSSLLGTKETEPCEPQHELSSPP